MFSIADDHLMVVLRSYAPTVYDEEICNEMAKRMLSDGKSERTIHLALARTLHDGLAFGKWPWISRTVTKCKYYVTCQNNAVVCGYCSEHCLCFE